MHNYRDRHRPEAGKDGPSVNRPISPGICRNVDKDKSNQSEDY